METIEHELDKAANGMPWLDSWEELKEIVRKSTWERFESKLNEEQREIVHLIACFREGAHDVRYIWKNDIIRAAERKGSIAQAGR